MQIESLKIYCDVVRHRSFSQAAELNAITQSAVSQIVSHIEKRLNVNLIDRSTRPLRPTEAGRQYFESCTRIVDDYFAVEAKLLDRSTPVDTPVSLAAIYSIGLRDMSLFVETFHRTVPGAKVKIEYLHPDEVHERVLNETADLGLLSFPRKSRDLIVHPWREEEICLACSPTHPFAQRTKIRPVQIEGQRFVAFNRELEIRRKIDRYLRENGVNVDICMEFDNIENIKRAVCLGEGMALLPRPTLDQEVSSGAIAAVPLSGEKFYRPIGLIHHRHRLSPLAQKFLEILMHTVETPLSHHDAHQDMVMSGT